MPARKVVVTSLTAFLLLVLFYLLFKILLPFIPSFLWAVIVVILSWPLYIRVRQKLRSRTITALLFTVLALLFLIIPFTYLISRLVAEAKDLYPVIEEKVNDPEWVANFKEHRVTAFILKNGEKILNKLEVDPGQLISNVSQNIASTSGTLVKNIGRALFRLAMSMIFIFILYRNGPAILEGFRNFIPLSQKRCLQMEKDIYALLKSIFFGIFFTAVIQGIMGGIGFAVLGLPTPLFFGAVMAFFSLFPVGGASIIWIPTAIILFASGDITKGIILLVWGGFLVSSLDNFIRPLLISGRSKFPLILVFIGALGGIMAFGLMGIFIGPIVLVITGRVILIFEEILFPGQEEEPAPASQG